MQSIADRIYIEQSYPGVTLGAVSLSHGLIQIDAPPSPEDGRSWRASMLGLGSGSERLLILLDAHPDRALGARALDCTVAAHAKTAQIFRNRPSTFKGQNDQTGANWELAEGIGSIRWASPDITFSDQMLLEWGGSQLILEHHPGPQAGAIWAIFPNEKIVFVGDTIVVDQPPFLAEADMSAWLDALETLRSPRFKDYTIIGGRNAVLSPSNIKDQINFLEKVLSHLEKLPQKRTADEAAEKLTEALLPHFKFLPQHQKHYTQRLWYGLRQYYSRYVSTAKKEDE